MQTTIDELFCCIKFNQIVMQIDEELIAIDNQFVPKSPNWYGVGGNSIPLESRYIDAITRKQKLMEQRKNCIDMLNYVDSKIYQLPDGMACRILHLRFIAINYNHRKPKPYTLEEIAEIVGYSYRGLYKKYKRSLDLFIEVHNSNTL